MKSILRGRQYTSESCALHPAVPFQNKFDEDLRTTAKAYVVGC